MNREASEQGHSIFAQAFCDAFSKALAAVSPTNWQVSTVDTLLAPGGADESSLEYCLTFTGNLGGSCFVVFDRVEAEALAADDPAPEAARRDYSEVLGEVIHQAAAGLIDPLASAFGALAVEVAHAVATDPASVHGAQMLAVNDEGRSCSVRLFFTPELSETLAPAPAAGTPANLNAQPGPNRDANRDAHPDANRDANLNLVMDVELHVTLRFGKRQLSLREILDLGSGSVVELDRQVDEPVELILDGRVIARGEAVIIDGNYGVRVTEVLEAVTPAATSGGRVPGGRAGGGR